MLGDGLDQRGRVADRRGYIVAAVGRISTIPARITAESSATTTRKGGLVFTAWRAVPR